jgi:DNA-directed RNA polymerase III subunit RPC2
MLIFFDVYFCITRGIFAPRFYLAFVAFAGDKVHDVGQVLVDNGFNYDGKDYFTSGVTG